jgi:hypothetical protein
VAGFLSAEWFAALNVTLADAGPPPLSASTMPFRVVFELADAPGSAPHAITFFVDDAGARAEAGDHLAADAVIRLSYRDGEALTQGNLDSASALREGRVKIRGDVQGLVPLLNWLLSVN